MDGYPQSTEAHGASNETDRTQREGSLMPGKGKGAHGPSIKNEATYEALKRDGKTKAEAAAISNSALNKTGKRGKHRGKKG